MSKGGFSFGDHALHRLRKYYRGWIATTLFAAWKLPLNPRDRGRIMQLKESVDSPKVIDEGLPGSGLQIRGLLSRRDDKLACLVVMIINLIQAWRNYFEEHPERVEDLLVELDYVIEEWDSVSIIGEVGTGYRIDVAWRRKP